MKVGIALVLLIAALVFFILAAVGVGNVGRVNTLAAGLACFTGAHLVGHIVFP